MKFASHALNIFKLFQTLPGDGPPRVKELMCAIVCVVRDAFGELVLPIREVLPGLSDLHVRRETAGDGPAKLVALVGFFTPRRSSRLTLC